MLARPVYVWHSCQQPFHCLLAFWFFIFSSTFPFWLLYHLVNIGWFRGGRWVTEARPQGLRLRTSSLPSRPCAKESRTLQQKLINFWFVMSTNIQRIFTLDFLILGLALPPPPFPRTAVKILQKTAFSLVKSRLALRSLACLFVCLFVTMRKMASYTGKWLLLPPIDHIHMRNPFTDQTGPGKRSSQSFA